MPTTLDDYTFRLGDTGVILNDDPAVPFVDILAVQGFDSAEVRETERDWEGTEGTFLDAEFEKGRRILLEGEVYADIDGIEAYLDSLKENWAPSRLLIPLYLKAPGVVERCLLVKPLGVRYRWETTRRYGKAIVQFNAFAEDPRIYSAEEHTLLVSLNTTPTTGFSFSFGFDLDFGSITGSLGTNAFNYGNRSTPFVATIFGPSTNPRIFNDDTGDEMDFEIALASDQTLEVNTRYRTVRLDGITNRRSALVNPSWFDLVKGNNHLKLFADDATAAYMNVTYRSAWR